MTPSRVCRSALGNEREEDHFSWSFCSISSFDAEVFVFQFLTIRRGTSVSW